ncbi:MAG: Uma2 family endonuclease [Ktedonobacteraceae bacterium]
MTALPERLSMSVEEYLQLDQNSTDTRYEYSDGYVTMLAGGTLNHSKISFNVARTLYELLRNSGCQVFTSDARVRLSKTRYVYPDVTISCDERDDGAIDTIEHPRLVVEVLSPGTESYDRGKKFIYYQQCLTIQEYMLVNTDQRAVEVFRREKNDLWIYQIFQSDSAIELLNLGVYIPFAASYENVILAEDEQ